MFYVTKDGETFLRELPTEGERAAFAEEFPHEFYRVFGFVACISDEWPASTYYHLRGIFRHSPDEFFKLLEGHPPRSPFDPPDVSGLHYYPEQLNALALARGRWWKQNKWPMTEAELAWMKEHE